MLEKRFKKLIEKYMNYIFSIIYRIIIPPHSNCDVEDIVSEVYETIWKNLSKIKSDEENGNEKAYIASIARSRSLDFLNSNHIEFELDDEIMIDDSDMEEDIMKSILEEEVRKIVGNMPEPEREILIRYYFYYQKIRTISEEMKLNENTVKTKLFRSRDVLKEKLEEVLGNEI